MFPGGLKLIFGRKLKKSYFRPKVDPGGQKTIFDQKIESSTFRPKLTPKYYLEVSNGFLDEKLTLKVKNQFLKK